MPAEITISNTNYGPNPFFTDTGGHAFFKFEVAFSDSPPASFNYEVKILDRDGNTTKTITGTKETPGQSENAVTVYWDAKDDSGQQASIGGYGPTITITAAAYTSVSQQSCTGLQITKNDDDEKKKRRKPCTNE